MVTMNSFNLKKGKTVGKLMEEVIVSIGAEESQVREISGAVVGAEELIPLLCSVMRNTELKVSKGTPARGKRNPIFIRTQFKAAQMCQSHCKHRLQGVMCTFYQ